MTWQQILIMVWLVFGVVVSVVPLIKKYRWPGAVGLSAIHIVLTGLFAWVLHSGNFW